MFVKGLNLYVTDDDTYLDNEDDLKKHLIDEVGSIWRGTARQPRPLLWEYGQVSNAHPRLKYITLRCCFCVVYSRMSECGTSTAPRSQC